VAVLARAGYGKSTLLAQAIARLDVPWVWCSCDARMTQPASLVAHLTAGLAERFPGFGAHMEFRGSADEQATALANEIAATVDEDFVLVLDDVHTLRDAAAGALSLLVSDLPPQAHLALAGRAPLPFPLGGVRAARALELGPRDLALSSEESRALLSAAGREVDSVTLEEVQRQSEGWVTGLILASQVSVADLREALESGRLVEYLAEEVFAGQPWELQRADRRGARAGRGGEPRRLAVNAGRVVVEEGAEGGRVLVRGPHDLGVGWLRVHIPCSPIGAPRFAAPRGPGVLRPLLTWPDGTAGVNMSA
jgi:ATP/maltotriose-dependent transcriptional regulator MalT